MVLHTRMQHQQSQSSLNQVMTMDVLKSTICMIRGSAVHDVRKGEQTDDLLRQAGDQIVGNRTEVYRPI
jgi:hypothetical protein